MLFNIRPVKDIPCIKKEIIQLIEKQKPGTWDDLSPFQSQIDELLSCFSEFNPAWKRLPIVYRIARVKAASTSAAKEGEGETRVYSENVELPNTKHDIDLVLKMLNHMRKEKGLAEVKMPLFVQPDEIAIARQGSLIDYESADIISQLSIVFQKGSIILVGFVFGRNYVLLEN